MNTKTKTLRDCGQHGGYSIEFYFSLLKSEENYSTQNVCYNEIFIKFYITDLSILNCFIISFYLRKEKHS